MPRNIPKRFSIAVAFPRDGGEALCLGISEKQSDLIKLLDDVDPAEIAAAGIVKDIQFTVKKTFAEPGVNPNPAPSSSAPRPMETLRRVDRLEDFTDIELQTVVAPAYHVDPANRNREQLLQAIYTAAGYLPKSSSSGGAIGANLI
jgi:hypothetical protein